MKRALFGLLFALTACVQGTGGQLVSFDATAVGTPAAASFSTPSGFDVTLTRAKLLVGAVYLNQQNPSNYTEETACILPGIYTGEVRSSLVVDALSATPQPFSAKGNGSDIQSLSAELWLADGDVSADNSKTVILDVAGTATKGTDSWPFTGQFTIGINRALPPRDPALPGSNPICKQRIVTPIPVNIQLAQAGTLQLTVDPRDWFNAVDFSKLTPSAEVAGRFDFIDDTASAGAPDLALYNGMHAFSGPYAFDWISP